VSTSSDLDPIVPPATIGVLGGGQLGRYAVLAARVMGYRTVVLEPDPRAPAGRLADEHLVAAYDDAAAVDHLAATCAVVTTEFENPPAATLATLAERTLVAPGAAAVAVCQDRRSEKRFCHDHRLPTAPFAVVEDVTDLDRATMAVRFPALLKTARLGYDGKGQVTVPTADELAAAWDALDRVPCVLEQRLHLDAELSALVARTADGRTAAWPVTENHHVGGILELSVVPARVDAAIAAEAIHLALTIAERLDYVGVLAVELFVVGDHLLVNELAPRPHNSGHWTLDASATSQFAQQVRAVCGLGLGPTTLTAPAAAMVNLLGDRWAAGEPDWAALLAHPDARLHLYGKHEPRPGRKMGHVTVTAATADEAAALARALAAATVRR
jgi:5-(carboxyamino)imidazole ribonucleotide synthase